MKLLVICRGEIIIAEGSERTLWAYATKITQDAAWCELNISAAQEPRNLSNLAKFPETVSKQIWGINSNYVTSATRKCKILSQILKCVGRANILIFGV